ASGAETRNTKKINTAAANPAVACASFIRLGLAKNACRGLSLRESERPHSRIPRWPNCGVLFLHICRGNQRQQFCADIPGNSPWFARERDHACLDSALREEIIAANYLLIGGHACA